MRLPLTTRLGAVLVAALAAPSAMAHHALAAKFDDTKPLSLAGIVTLVDWRNPHVHVFVNVTKPDKSIENWAVELESTVLLKKSGWSRTTLAPGDAIKVEGIAARDGTRQVWGSSVVQAGTNRRVLNVVDTARARCSSSRARACR
jgi:hypothetical protein